MDDAALWERWKTKQDAGAFAEIVSRHAAMVHSVSRRVLRNAADADDVAQECFLELIRTRPTVVSSLGALLHTLALRRSLDRLKADASRRARERRADERRVYERSAAAPLGAIDPHAERADLQEILARVDEAIGELPDKLRGPVVLRFLEGRSPREAAALLDIPESTLRLRIETGVVKVRSALKRRGIEATQAVLLTALAGEALEAAPPDLIATLGKIAISGGSLPEIPRAPTARDIARPASWILTGAMLMKKKMLVLAALLILLACGVAYRALDLRSSPPAAPAGGLARGPTTPPVPPEAEPRATTAERKIPAAVAERAPDAAPERWVDVLCLDDRGETAGGAEVFLVEKRTAAGGAAPSVSFGPRIAGAAGVARFGGLPSPNGLWRIEAFARAHGQAAGFAARQIADPHGEAGSEPLTIVLVPAAGLQGIVTVPDGYDPTKVSVRITGISMKAEDQPLGESLEAAPGPLARALETRPGKDGAFELDGLPVDAMVHLEADAPGLARAEARTEAGWEVEGIELRLAHEAAIEGTLRFADTLQPAAGVQLEAQLLPAGGSFQAAVEAGGRFRIAGLPEGSYSIALASQSKESDWTLRVAGPLPVAAGETTGGLALVLERSGTVSGTVKNASTGAPVPAISIAAISSKESGRRQLAAAVSDAAGRYSLRVPPGESTLYVASYLAEYVYAKDQSQRRVTVVSGEEVQEVDFQLQPRGVPEPPVELGRARGRVLDPAGRPLERVPVRTFTLHDPERPFLGIYNRTVLTDGDGRYEATVLAGRPVYVQAGGRLHSSTTAEPFTVAKDEARAVEDLIVRPATGTLEGFVQGPGGTPIEGAEVRASSRSKEPEGDPALTDASGRFRLERLLEDEVLEVTVTKQGYATLRVAGLSSGARNLSLRLEPAGGEAR